MRPRLRPRGAMLVLAAGLASCGGDAGAPPRGAEGTTAASAPAAAPVPVRRLEPSVDPEAKLPMRVRRDVLPAVRRETPLRIVIDLAEQPDLEALAREADAAPTRAERKRRFAERLGGDLRARRLLADELRARPGVSDVRESRCIARVAFTGPASLVRELAARPDVLAAWARPLDVSGVPAPAPAESVTRDAPEWALQAMRVPQVWAAGFRGRGAHACIMETAPAGEPALLAGRRAVTAAKAPGSDGPDEGGGHGLAVLGAAVADGGLGVAPEATWSVVSPLHGGSLEPESFAAAVDWILFDAQPDVVIAPWDASSEVPEHQLAIPFGALRAAGMAVVFPAGNSGPMAGVNKPPANLVRLAPDGASALSVGGVGADLSAYDASNRGPNARDTSLFPLACAPAAGVRVLDVATGGITVRHGTSYAAGFAGGALAVLLGAHPEMTGPQAEKRLLDTARDLGEPGPDTTFGHGLLDVERALAP